MTNIFQDESASTEYTGYEPESTPSLTNILEEPEKDFEDKSELQQKSEMAAVFERADIPIDEERLQRSFKTAIEEDPRRQEYEQAWKETELLDLSEQAAREKSYAGVDPEDISESEAQARVEMLSQERFGIKDIDGRVLFGKEIKNPKEHLKKWREKLGLESVPPDEIEAHQKYLKADNVEERLDIAFRNLSNEEISEAFNSVKALTEGDDRGFTVQTADKEYVRNLPPNKKREALSALYMELGSKDRNFMVNTVWQGMTPEAREVARGINQDENVRSKFNLLPPAQQQQVSTFTDMLKEPEEAGWIRRGYQLGKDLLYSQHAKDVGRFFSGLVIPDKRSFSLSLPEATRNLAHYYFFTPGRIPQDKEGVIEQGQRLISDTDDEILEDQMWEEMNRPKFKDNNWPEFMNKAFGGAYQSGLYMAELSHPAGILAVTLSNSQQVYEEALTRGMDRTSARVAATVAGPVQTLTQLYERVAFLSPFKGRGVAPGFKKIKDSFMAGGTLDKIMGATASTYLRYQAEMTQEEAERLVARFALNLGGIDNLPEWSEERKQIREEAGPGMMLLTGLGVPSDIARITSNNAKTKNRKLIDDVNRSLPTDPDAPLIDRDTKQRRAENFGMRDVTEEMSPKQRTQIEQHGNDDPNTIVAYDEEAMFEAWKNAETEEAQRRVIKEAGFSGDDITSVHRQFQLAEQNEIVEGVFADTVREVVTQELNRRSTNELRQIAKARGLKSTGKKTEIVSRLAKEVPAKEDLFGERRSKKQRSQSPTIMEQARSDVKRIYVSPEEMQELKDTGTTYPPGRITTTDQSAPDTAQAAAMLEENYPALGITSDMHGHDVVSFVNKFFKGSAKTWGLAEQQTDAEWLKHYGVEAQDLDVGDTFYDENQQFNVVVERDNQGNIKTNRNGELVTRQAEELVTSDDNIGQTIEDTEQFNEYLQQVGLEDATELESPDTPFSLTEQHARKSHIRKLRRKIDKLASKLGIDPNITLLDTFDELPAEVKENAEARGLDTRNIRGVTVGNDAYLVLENIEDTETALSVYMHEALGHRGIRQVFGPFLDNHLEAVRQEVGMEKIMSSVHPAELRQRPNETTRQYQNRITEEYVAVLAESVRQGRPMSRNDMNIWQRILSWIKERLGIAEQYMFSDVESTAAAMMLRDAVEHSHEVDLQEMLGAPERVSPEGEVMYSLSETEGFRRPINDQRHDRMRMAAVTYAYRMAMGEDITVDMIRDYLAQHGLEHKAETVLNRADRIYKNAQNELEGLQDELLMMSSVQGQEQIDHYLSLIDNVVQYGKERGEQAEQARQQLEQRRQETIQRHAKIRRGRSLEEIEESIDDPVSRLRNVKTKTGRGGEGSFAAIANDIKEAVRQGMIREGVINEDTDINRSVIFKSEYAQTLRNVIRQTAVREQVPYSNQRETMARNIEQALDGTTINQINEKARQALSSMNDALLKQDVKELRKEFRKLVDKKEFRKRTGREEWPNIKFKPATQRWANLVRKVTSLGEQATNTALRRINELENDTAIESASGSYQQAIEELGTLTESLEKAQSIMDEFYEETGLRVLKREYSHLSPLDQLRVARKAIEQYGYFNQRSAQELAEMVETMNDEITGGAMEMEGRIEARRERLESEREKLSQAFVEHGKKVPEEESIVSSIGQFLSVWSGSFPNKLKSLANRAPEAIRNQFNEWVEDITDRIQQADNQRDTNMRKTLERWQDDMKSILGARNDLEIKRYLYRPQEKYRKYSHQGKPLNKDMLLQIISSYEQGKLSNEFYTEEMIANIKKELNNKDWQVLEWWRQFYRDVYPQINEAYKKVTMAELPRPHLLYTPVMSNQQPGLTEQHRTFDKMPRFFHTRTQAALHRLDEAQGLNAVGKFYVQQMYQFEAFSDLSLYMRGLFQDENFIRQMQKVASRNELAEIFDHLATILTGQNYLEGKVESIGSGLRVIRQATTALGLGFNVSVAIGQMTSFPAFGLNIGLKDTIKAMSLSVRQPGKWWELVKHIWQSEERVNRMKLGHSEAVRALYRDGAMKSSRAGWFLQKAFRTGLAPIAFGDIVPTHIIGPGIYLDRYNQELARGASEAVADERAMSHVFKLTNLTQQSQTVQGQKRWQRASIGHKMFMIYQTSPAAFFDYELAAIREFKRRPDAQSTQKVLSTLFINHVLLPGMYYGLKEVVGQALGEEPDDETMQTLLVRMAIGPLSAIMTFGAISESIIEAALTGDKPWVSGYTPATQVFDMFVDTGVLLNHAGTINMDVILEEADMVMSHSAAYYDAKTMMRRIFEEEEGGGNAPSLFAPGE